MRSQHCVPPPVACAAGLGLLLLPRALSSAGAPELRASARGMQPLSCKVSSPLRVSLDATATGGTWRIHLNASESAPAIRVTMWAATPSGETRPQTVWQGGLRRDEARDLDVRAALPADALEIFAQAEVVSRGGVILRSRAESPGPAAKTALATAPERVTVNPQTGETVVEYPGRIGGTR